MRQSGGKLFTVYFKTRGKGNLRKMTCRRGVSKGVSGAGQPFDADSCGLLTVNEFVGVTGDKGRRQNDATQFRHISLEGVRYLAIQGEQYLVH